ncbi:MAG: FAD-dependent oxidoreductase [Kiloniellales bacterium]|nr:FAD-dependent oxidoreductase [Kiloniellales bacterium]
MSGTREAGSERSPERVPEQVEVAIVGGGVIGLSLAYHLGQLGARDVLLLERNALTSGTSWHAAGIVGPLRASLNLTRLSIYATELFARLEAETGQATGYRRTGGLWLAQTQDRLIELKRIAAMGEMTGLDARILAPGEVGERFSLLRTDDLAGALWVEEDGQVNPVDLCMAYARGARAAGVRIREQAQVAAIERRAQGGFAIALADGGRVEAAKVANCAGVWARQVGALAGVPVPVQAAEHMYVVSEPVAGLPAPCPVVRDLDAGIYLKEDAGKLVLGGFEPDAKPWDAAGANGDAPFLMLPEDWDHFEPFLAAGLARLPILERTGIQHFMNGPEGFTPDTRQVLGEAPGVPNFFVAAGFNSIGIVSSAGAGRALAEWIVAGAPPMDLWEVDLARFEPYAASRRFLAERVREAVGTQFDMHWPFKQPRTGRGAKRAPLHEAFAAQGAVFGAPAGWERPLWFATTPDEAEVRDSYGDQGWWPSAAREAAVLARNVALFELTSFTKILLQGPDTERFLQRLCANDVAVAPGRTVYSQMLNARGGIEADVTVTRLDGERFWLVSGAATRAKDLAWLRRHLSAGERVAIVDLTSAYAVLGVMGPRARDLLASLSDADLSDDAFAFAACREIEVGPAPVRATRLSFVGELGWELTVANDYARAVHRALLEAGAAFGLAPAGHYCLEACRLEKGFRHWGHDIGPDDTPLEAGLGFAVAWDKPGGFLGREALLRLKESGVARRLVLFQVAAGTPLVLHDEPIYRDGALVGRTTSGGRGFRTGLTLALGYVSAAPGVGHGDLLAGRYEIGVAGTRFPLAALPRAPYDPDGRRMRS